MPKVSPEYRDERRADILAAARRCFVREGFHQTSMQDLVREAGMSAGAIYRYFDSKDAMIAAIAEQNLDQVVSTVQAAVRNGDSVGAAVASALEYVAGRHADEGFGAIALLAWSEALRNSALAARLTDSFTTAVDALAEVARAGPASAAAPPPETLANALLCVLPGYLLQLTIRGPDAVESVPDALRALTAAG